MHLSVTLRATFSPVSFCSGLFSPPPHSTLNSPLFTRSDPISPQNASSMDCFLSVSIIFVAVTADNVHGGNLYHVQNLNISVGKSKFGGKLVKYVNVKYVINSIKWPQSHFIKTSPFQHVFEISLLNFKCLTKMYIKHEYYMQCLCLLPSRWDNDLGTNCLLTMDSYLHTKYKCHCPITTNCNSLNDLK